MNPNAWLTEQEQEQVALVAQDLTMAQIAKRVGRSVSAVHSTATRIRTKLGVSSQAAIVHWAWHHGYLGDRTELLAKIKQQNAELTRINAELGGRPKLTAEIMHLRGLMQRQNEDRSVLLNRIDNLELMYRAAVLQKKPDAS
jgi:DNA-binding CsgD family transcriptional regulator